MKTGLIFLSLFISNIILAQEWDDLDSVVLLNKKNCEICIGRMKLTPFKTDLIVCNASGTDSCKNTKQCLKNKIAEKKPKPIDENFGFRITYIKSKERNRKIKVDCKIEVVKVNGSGKEPFPFEKWSSKKVKLDWTSFENSSPSNNLCKPDKESEKAKCIGKISLPGNGESTFTCLMDEETKVGGSKGSPNDLTIVVSDFDKNSKKVYMEAIAPKKYKGKIDWFFKHVFWAKHCNISGDRNQFVNCPHNPSYERTAKAKIIYNGDRMEALEVFPISSKRKKNDGKNYNKVPPGPFQPIIVPQAQLYWPQGYY